jgi:hypothetical protein
MFGQGTFSESPFASEGGAVPGIKPGVANLSLVGFQPGVSGPVEKVPGAQNLSLVGSAPDLKNDFRYVPGAGSLALVGAAPKTVLTDVIQPNAGSLSFNSVAPIVSRSNTENPGVRAVSIVGFVPRILESRTPSSASISVLGHAPTAIQTVAPATQTLAILGFVPEIRQAFFVSPDTVDLSLLGFAPIVNAAIPATNDAVFVGHAPNVVQDALVTPTGGSVIVGSAPVIAVTGITKVPGTASLNIVDNAPEIATQVFVPTGTINIASDQPFAFEGSFVNTVVGAASFVGHAPSLLGGFVSNPGSQSLAIVGSIPKTAFTITPVTGTLSIVGTTSGVRNPNWTNVNTSQTPNWELIAA